MNSTVNVEKIIIADDHPLFRSALVQALKSIMSEVTFLEAANISELEQVLIKNTDADLLLMDLHMPGANGFVGLTHIIKNYSQLPVMMISANEDLEIAASAQHYGALGFIPKSASISEISEAIEKILMGELCFPAGMVTHHLNSENELECLINKIAELTPKQLEVFNLLSVGLLNKQIAWEQQVTEATVKAHVTAIMRKLNVNNRTQIVLIANKVKVDENYGKSSDEV